jgi:hypothetical protein
MRTRSVSRALLALLFAGVSAATFGAGCGVDNELVGGTCAAGYAQCGLHCVRLDSDRENCGGCGHACGPGSACTGGACHQGFDASADAALASEGAAEEPTLREGSPGLDGGGLAATGEAMAGDAPTSAEPTEAASAEDAAAPMEAGADEPSVDGSIPVDPVDPTAPIDAGISEGASGDPDSGSVGSIDAAGDDSSAADSTVDSGAFDSAGTDSPFDISTPDEASANDGSAAEAANPCAPPLVSCGGACIDVTGDPLNCGACNVVCASQLCDDAACVGAASGGIVYIGHDYTTTLPGTAQARVLSNAVFVAESNPLHVLSYERYARASAISHVDAILDDVAHQVGRTLRIVSTITDDDVPEQLVLPSYDVLLVHDQAFAPDGALAALGANWASTLSTFTLGGGVVIVLDGGGGIGQMPALATASTLLGVSAHAPAAVGTPLLVTSHVDFVGIGVISPYGAGQSSVSLATEANGGNVVYVVEIGGDAGSNAPIVVHKAF